MIFQQKKYWICVAALWVPWLILCVLTYLFVLEPLAQKYKTVHTQFASSNDLVSVARLASLEDTKQRQQAQLDELQAWIDSYCATEAQQDQVIFEISRLANAFALADYAGKTKQNVWGTGEDEEVKIQRVWMTITFKAPFQQFAAFVNAMERNCPAVFIESARIEKSQDRANQHRAKLLISFFTEAEKNDADPDKGITSTTPNSTEGSSS